jgi:hypothetical protein
VKRKKNIFIFNYKGGGLGFLVSREVVGCWGGGENGGRGGG